MLDRLTLEARQAARRERRRRYRERQRPGRIVVPVEIDDAVVSWLVKIHALPPRECYMVAELGAAIAASLRVSSRP
jgi:hypothetical protein